MNLPIRLSAALARVENRHWIGLGASMALHLTVLLGLRQAPLPEPKPVSFEIALEAPKPEALARTKTKSHSTDAKAKPKKTLAKRKPAKREPHTLETHWRGESKPPKEAPSVALPDARELGIQAPGEEAIKPRAAVSRHIAASTSTSAATSISQTETDQQVTDPTLSEPGQTGPATAGQSGPVGEPGIVLTASTILSRGLAAVIGRTSGAQSAEAASGLSTSGQTNSAGQGPGSLTSSQGSGAGLNVAAGNGAQSRSSLEAPAQAGGEPQGIRLTAAGALSERTNLPAGSGGLAAGPVSVESGRAAPSQAQGNGTALASTRAGGASANPLPTPGKQAGGGARGASADRSASQASASREAIAKLEGSGGQARSPTGQDKHASKTAGKGQGGAPSEHPTSRGDASGEGMALVASTGRLGSATAGVGSIRIKTTGSGPGTSQSGTSLALAPGEPGSSPKLAVAMQPLLAKPGIRYGGGRGGADAGTGMASDSSGAGTTYPGTTLARMGGGDKESANRSGLVLASGSGVVSAHPEGAPAGSGAHGTMSGGGPAQAGGSAIGIQKEPARLQTVKLAETQVMRPDTQAKPLDVLAPSTYCPLPLPGHSFPNNRPPKPDQDATTTPAYAQDNPSFIFPIQAWAANIEGKAVVRVEVQPDGKPGRMWLKQSSGSGILDRDAQVQLTLWHFIPARKNGQPVTAWIDVPVVYRLQEAKK